MINWYLKAQFRKDLQQELAGLKTKNRELEQQMDENLLMKEQNQNQIQTMKQQQEKLVKQYKESQVQFYFSFILSSNHI